MRWLVLALLALPCVFAFDWYVPGTIHARVDIDRWELSASFAEVHVESARGGVSLLLQEGEVGDIELSFTLQNFTQGSAQLVSAGKVIGTASLTGDAVRDMLVVERLNVDLGVERLGLWSAEETLQREVFADVQVDGKEVGRMSIKLVLRSIEESELSLEAKDVGIVRVSLVLQDILDFVQPVTNLFAGFVEGDAEQVVVVTGVQEFRAPIRQVGDKFGYGFSGEPVAVTGLLGEPVLFFVNGEQVGSTTLSSDTTVRRVDLKYGRPRAKKWQFNDTDSDGVMEDRDICPNSFSWVVDPVGCSCDQLIAKNGGGSCVLTSSGPKWVAPPPPPPPPAQCDVPNECVGSGPYFCDENKQLVKACSECGCPNGFTCNPEVEGEVPVTDEGCYRIVQRANVSCAKNDFQIGWGLNCSVLGEGYAPYFSDPTKGDLTQFIDVDVHTNYFAQGTNRRQARNSALRYLRGQQVCITQDVVGCVPVDTSCPGEEVKADPSFEVIDAIQQQVDVHFRTKTRRGSENDLGAHIKDPRARSFVIPLAWQSIGGECCSKVVVKYDFKPSSAPLFQIRDASRACPALLVPPEASCAAAVVSGSSEANIDVFVVGDGFRSFEELDETVAAIFDVDLNSVGTAEEGVFSREPFKSRRSKFNVWLLQNDSIELERDSYIEGRGETPTVRSVAAVSSLCPQRDLTLVVSRDDLYQSRCLTKDTCVLSLKDEPFPGRRALYLLGQWLGLRDEFVFLREVIDSPGHAADLDFAHPAGPNCVQDSGAAADEWGDLQAPGSGVGFFKGCGGECGAWCDKFVRPTFSSTMRNYSARCLSESCSLGPPFDPFYIVNEAALLEKLDEFGAEAEIPEEESSEEAAPGANS